MITDKKELNKILKGVDTFDVAMVQLLADDVTRPAMAEILGVGIKTLEKKMYDLRHKFGCHKEAPLITIFFRAKLIK